MCVSNWFVRLLSVSLSGGEKVEILPHGPLGVPGGRGAALFTTIFGRFRWIDIGTSDWIDKFRNGFSPAEGDVGLMT